MTGPEPSFRVVRGTPTAEELAALVGALRIRTRERTPPAAGPSPWVRRGRPVADRLPDHRGPVAWRGRA